MKLRLNGFGHILVFTLIALNLIGGIVLGLAVSEAHTYGNRGSFSVAEAAYLGALWSEIAAKASAGVLLNIALGIGIFLSRQVEPARDAGIKPAPQPPSPQ